MIATLEKDKKENNVSQRYSTRIIRRDTRPVMVGDIGIGGDNLPEKSLEFAKGYNVEFPIVTDPDSILSGIFKVFSMPATFLVDRQGVVRFMDTGFKPAEQESKLRNAILGML